jgi:hypothetical protein
VLHQTALVTIHARRADHRCDVRKCGADIVHEDEPNLNARHHIFVHDCCLPYFFLGVRLLPLKCFLQRSEDPIMQSLEQASKRKKRLAKGAVPVLGAAGLTFALAGSASPSAVPTAGVPQTPNSAPSQAITLSDEEIADVSLATFHLFDHENISDGILVAARGCGGCRGCGGARGCGGVRGCGGCRGGFRGCRGCRGVGFRGCGCGGGCGGCGGCVGISFGWGAGCCASWGSCRWC